MSRNLKLFAQGAFGYFMSQALSQKNIKYTLYTSAKNISKRSIDRQYLREGYPYRYLNENQYDPSILEIKENDLVLCVDWIKNFFHNYIPPTKVYILHPSLLPKYKGYGAVSEQFLKGVAIGGVSILEDSTQIDCGDIVFQQQIPIGFNDYPLDYIEKCVNEATPFIISLLNKDLEQKNSQDHNNGYSIQRFRQKQGLIDINMNAIYVYNTIRAFSHPYFGASLNLKNIYLRVFRATCENWSGFCGKPGEILNMNKNGVEVACGDGSVLISEVEFAGETYKFEDISKLLKNH